MNAGGTLNWTASDNASWLSVTPGSGSGSGTLTASVNTSGLAEGTYNGTITLTAGGATTHTVGVTLTVNPPATSSATLTWDANTESDLASYRVYRSTTPGAYGSALATVPTGTTGYVATGLQMGTTYYFVVTAVDSSDNESQPSNEVSKSIF
jgi:fibronectin type 3 domain-containing protein